jgi:broad specificity phosphatase PhoE
MKLSPSLVLVKHAQPVLEADVAARYWRLGAEGEAQARRLARELERFQPFQLVSSHEPKAAQTAALVAHELGVVPSLVAGIEEFDRPPLPILASEEHERLNQRIFETPTLAVLGTESLNSAVERFRAGLTRALDALPTGHDLVAITHGTVMAGFIAQTASRDPFQLWKQLRCPSLVVLDLPTFGLREIKGSL